jgi:hypothetical protein
MASLLARLDTPLFARQSGVKVTLLGTGTSWTAGTPGTPTFTVSAGTKTAQTVVNGTTATLTFTAPTTPGVVTITDPGTSATATVRVRPVVRYVPPRR